MTSRSSVLQAMARIDQHQRPLEHCAPAQIIVDQEAPAPDHVLGRFGEAVAGHVDQPDLQRLADVEEIELLRPARRVRRARQTLAVGERIEQRALADVRAPGEGDFRHVGVGQKLQLGRRLQELDRPGEQLARAFGRSRSSAWSLMSWTGCVSREMQPVTCGTATIAGRWSADCWTSSRAAGRRERRHDEHQHPRHDREDLLLRRVHLLRVELASHPHG